MIDKILIVISLLALVAFCGVVVTFVAEPDLAITVLLILFIASHDFWISVFRKQDGDPELEETPLESRPHGVAGRALTDVEGKQQIGGTGGQTSKKKTRKKAKS